MPCAWPLQASCVLQGALDIENNLSDKPDFVSPGLQNGHSGLKMAMGTQTVDKNNIHTAKSTLKCHSASKATFKCHPPGACRSGHFWKRKWSERQIQLKMPSAHQNPHKKAICRGHAVQAASGGAELA